VGLIMGQHPVTREGVIKESLKSMQQAGKIDEGEFSAMGMLITDSLLSRDVVALNAAHDGLRWLYGHRRGNVIDTGRLLGLIDVTFWALRRIG
jgi:hypothetical protein